MILLQSKKKNLFNRSISSLLKWKIKKEDKKLVLKKKNQPFYPYIFFNDRNLLDYTNNIIQKIKKLPIKKTHMTFLNSFLVINNVRKNILSKQQLPKGYFSSAKNISLGKLHTNIIILFFLIKTYPVLKKYVNFFNF